MTKNKKVQFALDEQTFKKLKNESERDGLSISAFTRLSIIRELRSREDKRKGRSDDGK